MLWLPKLWTPERERIRRAQKMRSRRGFAWWPCCCVRQKVLIWRANSHATGTSDLDEVQAYYGSRGVLFDTEANWSGTLADYELIFFPKAISNPSWWSEITGETWQGRLVITAENSTNFQTSIDYVDGLSAMTGISVNSVTNTLPNTHSDGPTAADPLTAGISVIWYGTTTTVSGGTTLATTTADDTPSLTPFIAHNKPGDIDFVISGDVNVFMDAQSANNEAFFGKLLDVAV